MSKINKGTGITINLSCKHGALLFKNPDINIDINGVNYVRKFGKHFFEQASGSYIVKISMSDFMGKSFDDKLFELTVSESTETLVKYNIDLMLNSCIELKQKPKVNPDEDQNEDDVRETKSAPSKSLLVQTAGLVGTIVGFTRGILMRIKKT